MKKILFMLLCLFSLKFVNAEELNAVLLPYYIKLKDTNEIIRVKMFNEVESKVKVFNLDIYNYENPINVSKEIINEDDIFSNKIDEFNTIVYYGYNNSPRKKLNYFYAQVLIWKDISNIDFEIVDEVGNRVYAYDIELNNLAKEIENHNKNSSFFDKTHSYSISDEIIFEYDSIVLDNPNIEGLNFSNKDNLLYIKSDKIGNYEINLFKDFENENYVYKNGSYIYYSSLKGPGDLKKKFYLNIGGLKLIVKEQLESINGKYGDAILNSKYQLFLEDNVINYLNNSLTFEVIPNVSYTLKDFSENIGFNKFEDININILNEDYELIIKREIIKKDIQFNIDNNTYKIYLKSNNELYKTLNKSEKITLPYGLYYIVNEENDYYEEIKIYDNKEEVLNIKINKIDEEDSSTKEENFPTKEDADIKLDEIVENPKTLDNFYINVFVFVISLFTLKIFFKRIIYNF